MTDDPAHAPGRIPPQDLAAERAVLGAVFLDNAAGLDALASLHPDAFYFTSHRHIAGAMLALGKAGTPVDVLTVAERLMQSQDGDTTDLNAAGGAAYVAELSGAVPSAANAKHYAKIVRDRALLRDLANKANDVVNRAHEPGADASALLSDLAKIAADTDSSASDVFEPASKVANRLLDEMQAMVESGVAREFHTGVSAIDENLWVRPTDFFVIAGRPGTGKTHVATEIMDCIAMSGRGVCYASGEMPAVDLVARAAKRKAVIDSEVFRRKTSPERIAKAAQAVFDVGKLPIWFTTETSHDAILRGTRALARKGKVGALVVDMLQRLRLPSGMKRTDELLGDLCRDFKNFALRERIPVFMVSSMNRSASDDDSARPTMKSLRGSGEIESEADTVLLLHRRDDCTEWIFEKAREGCAGRDRGLVRMRRDFARGRFVDADAPEETARFGT